MRNLDPPQQFVAPPKRSILSIPQGSHAQQCAALRLFDEFLVASNLSWERVTIAAQETAHATQNGTEMPDESLYSILESWVMYLFKHESGRTRNKQGLLSTGTADNYLSQVKQYLLDRFGSLDENRCRKIRSKMKKMFGDRALQLQIVQNQAPPATVNDMTILVSSLFSKGDSDSVQFASLLCFQWHMFGRSVDSCWLLKSQLAVMSGGELFVTFTRLKTSTLQGVSMYNHHHEWKLCPIHALAVAIITSQMPTPLVFNMVPLNDVEPAIRANVSTSLVGVVSQLEAAASGVAEAECDAVIARDEPENVRKRPSAAQFINTRLKALEAENKASSIGTSTLGHVPLTPGLQSHSMRRGSAQWVSACYKIAVQWLCSRGMWMMDSLSKAFAYIGTTLKEDQKVAKRLSDWDPDDDVQPPLLLTLTELLDTTECDDLARIQRELFASVTGFDGESATCNVDSGVVNLLFSTVLLNYGKTTAEYPDSSLRRAVLRACKTSSCDEDLLVRAGNHLQQRFTGQLGRDDKSCDGCNIQATVVELTNRVDVLTAKIDALVNATAAIVSRQTPDLPLKNVFKPAPSEIPTTSASIAGFVYSWYTDRLWEQEFVGKKQQSALSDMCSRLAILKITYGRPLHIATSPPRVDPGYNAWKTAILQVSHALGETFNAVLGTIDGKKTTMKASSVRRRFQQVCTDAKFRAVLSLADIHLKLGLLIDELTPVVHQKETQIVTKILNEIARVGTPAKVIE